jgi:hypothetical protein
MTDDQLAPVLADSRVRTLRDLYDSHERRATAAQRVFRQFSTLFIVATALASVSGALILYGTGAGEADPVLQRWLAQQPVRLILFVVEVAALAAAAFAAEMRREQKNDTEWLAERRAAERCRIAIWERIMAVAAETGPDAERAAFDRFVEEQLGVQMSYYASAEARHKRSASRSTVIGAVTAAAIAATGAAGIGGELWVAVAAFVGVVSPVLLNALRAWRDDTLDSEKAERYRAAWTELKRLEARGDEVRRALDAGEPKSARDFIDQVHAVLRQEHENWTPTAARE